jgi:hypothetical protein
LINKKTLATIKGNPQYLAKFKKSFIGGTPFGKTLNADEKHKVADFLLSHPDVLSKGP